MKRIIVFAMCLQTALAHADQCVMQEKTVSRSQVTIVERGNIRRDVVPNINGGKKCIVDLRVRIGLEWYTAFGEQNWDGSTSIEQACAMALTKAEESAKARVASTQVISEKTLVCKDRPELNTLRNTNIGNFGDAGQFRMHPNYPNRFIHNGAQCRWFLEPEFIGKDIRSFQGIVCELQNGKWVVVDKF